MTGRIAIYSPGLLKLRHEIGVLTGLEPRLALPVDSGFAAVAGWGHKPTAARARRAARRRGLPYIAFEDGFLRSLKPGPAQRPSAMVADRTGIYYDARQPSDLETMLETAAFSESELSAAAGLIDLIRRHRLSKYNHGADRLADDLPVRGAMVLVIDQTAGDESIAGALASADSFARMCEAAAAENPGAQLVAKLHPETMGGAKGGHIAEAARRLGMAVLASHVSPWALLDRDPHVYTVSSQFGFEAALAGCRVTCFGTPFYAGWGLTDDRGPPLARRSRRRSRLELAAAAYLRYCRYFDAWFRTPVDAETAVDQLSFLRASYLANGRPVIACGIAPWKRRAVAAMLDGPHGAPRFVRHLPRAGDLGGATVAAWGIEALRLRPELERRGIGCLAIEDGFLRSVGLGAAFAQPLSLVFDASGLYYDPTRPSDIETMLASADLTAADVARAKRLRQIIVAERLSKYNVRRTAGPALALPPGKRVVLVPGQVADDWAVSIGRPPAYPDGVNVNRLLLESARRRWPGACVIFKPHPDVELLGRAGALDQDCLSRNADLVARNLPLENILPVVDHVETYSSLAGFEALLRDIPVSVHGLPFYAGWGLTEDLARSGRRGRGRTRDELAAVALLRYPRYWDPVSGLVCPPETAVRRILEARSSGGGAGTFLGMGLGRLVIMARRAGQRIRGFRR